MKDQVKRGKGRESSCWARWWDIQRPNAVHPLTGTALQVALLLRSLALTEGSSTVAYSRITAKRHALCSESFQGFLFSGMLSLVLRFLISTTTVTRLEGAHYGVFNNEFFKWKDYTPGRGHLSQCYVRALIKKYLWYEYDIHSKHIRKYHVDAYSDTLLSRADSIKTNSACLYRML